MLERESKRQKLKKLQFKSYCVQFIITLAIKIGRRNARKGIGWSTLSTGLRDVLIPAERLFCTGAPAARMCGKLNTLCEEMLAAGRVGMFMNRERELGLDRRETG
jgi:hypothetical protein